MVEALVQGLEAAGKQPGAVTANAIDMVGVAS
jgi:hypothetical protein